MRRIIWIAIPILLAFNSYAQKRAFTIEDLYKIKKINDPQVSPSGNKIAVEITNYYLEKGCSNTDIYMMNADGNDLERLTLCDAKDHHPRWSPDGKSLMFLSDRKEGMQIWILSANMAEAKQLTFLSTEVADPVWSPDGKYIAFSSMVFSECGADNDCNKSIINGQENGPLQAYLTDALFYRHWDSYTEGRYNHVMLLDLVNGKIKDLTPGNFNSPPLSLNNAPGFDFSPDSKKICFVSKRVKDPASSTNNDLFIVNIDSNEVLNITSENEACDADPKYSPDGKYIAYLKQLKPGYEADRNRLAIYDNVKKESRMLTENFLYNIKSYQWAPDSRYIYFIAEEQGYFPLYRIDQKSGKILKIPNVNASSGFQLSSNGRWIYFTDHRVGTPVDLYRYSLIDKKSEQITFLNKSLSDSVEIIPAEKVWIEGADGKMIHVFIVKPYHFDPWKKYPLIINVHGGPQMQWSDSFRGDWQVYPGAGYVVAFPNPHGSVGYGPDFTEAISGDWNGKVIEDIIKITKFLSKLEYIDENRIGAMGWSWGGYAMDWLEGHNEDDLFKCFVSMMGVYDLRSMYGATEELWFPEWDIGGQPWNSENYQTMSPSNYVENFKTPMLVITGELDYRVPYTQSLELFTDLQKMSVPSRLIIFKNDGHWPDYVKSMPFYYNAHLDWFHKHLGGGPARWDMKKMVRNQVFEN